MASLLDQFVGTAGTLLTAHTPDTGGGPWTVPSGGTSWTIGPSGEAYAAPSFTTRCFFPVGPTSTNVTVRAKFKRLTDVTGIVNGIFLGSDTGGTINGYFLRYIRSSSLWRVDKITAGTTSVLGSIAATVTDGVEYQLELSRVGTTITGKIGSTTVWTGTDSTHTIVGYTGVMGGGGASSATTGVHLTDFEQIDAAAAPVASKVVQLVRTTQNDGSVSATVTANYTASTDLTSLTVNSATGHPGFDASDVTVTGGGKFLTWTDDATRIVDIVVNLTLTGPGGTSTDVLTVAPFGSTVRRIGTLFKIGGVLK